MGSWTIFLDPCSCSTFVCSSLLIWICSVAPLEEHRKSGWISTDAYRKCSGLLPLYAICCRTLQRYRFVEFLHLHSFGTASFGLCLTNIITLTSARARTKVMLHQLLPTQNQQQLPWPQWLQWNGICWQMNTWHWWLCRCMLRAVGATPSHTLALATSFQEVPSVPLQGTLLACMFGCPIVFRISGIESRPGIFLLMIHELIQERNDEQQPIQKMSIGFRWIDRW